MALSQNSGKRETGGRYPIWAIGKTGMAALMADHKTLRCPVQPLTGQFI